MSLKSQKKDFSREANRRFGLHYVCCRIGLMFSLLSFPVPCILALLHTHFRPVLVYKPCKALVIKYL